MKNTSAPTQCTCPENAHSLSEICETCETEYQQWLEDNSAEYNEWLNAELKYWVGLIREKQMILKFGAA